jgi:hypothetical protein
MSGDIENWCPVKACCLSHGKKNCCDCVEYPNLAECPILNSVRAKIINCVKGSHPLKCLNRIREVGPQQYAIEMSVAEQWTIH